MMALTLYGIDNVTTDKAAAERAERIRNLCVLAAGCAARRYHPDGKTYSEFCQPDIAANWAIKTLAAIEKEAGK